MDNREEITMVSRLSRNQETKELSEEEIKNEYEKLLSSSVFSVNELDDEASEKAEQDIQESFRRLKERQLAKGVIDNEDISILLLKINKIIEDYEDNHFNDEEKNYLARNCMSLIWSCVMECAPTAKKTYTKEDVFGACLQGFTKALNKYKKNNDKYTFTAYAYGAMRNAVIDMVRKADTDAKHLPTTSWQVSINTPVLDEKLEVSANEAALSSREKTIRKEKTKEDLLTGFVRKEFFEEIDSRLTEDEKFIFDNYYMEKNMTLMELSDFFHVDKKTVNKMTKNVMQKMRDVAKDMDISYYDLI